ATDVGGAAWAANGARLKVAVRVRCARLRRRRFDPVARITTCIPLPLRRRRADIRFRIRLSSAPILKAGAERTVSKLKTKGRRQFWRSRRPAAAGRLNGWPPNQANLPPTAAGLKSPFRERPYSR